MAEYFPRLFQKLIIFYSNILHENFMNVRPRRNFFVTHIDYEKEGLQFGMIIV